MIDTHTDYGLDRADMTKDYAAGAVLLLITAFLGQGYVFDIRPHPETPTLYGIDIRGGGNNRTGTLWHRSYVKPLIDSAWRPA